MHSFLRNAVYHGEEDSGQIRGTSHPATEACLPLDLLLLHQLYRNLTVLSASGPDNWGPVPIDTAPVLREYHVQGKKCNPISKNPNIDSITVGGLAEGGCLSLDNP